MKFSESKDLTEKYRIEKENMRQELDKLYDQIRVLKDDNQQKYEVYSKQLTQSETEKEEQMRRLIRENENFKEESERIKRNF